MMLGGWCAGLGLALALRSPGLVAGCAVVIVAGCAYVRWIEEPRLLRRFGPAYRRYMDSAPRWIPC